MGSHGEQGWEWGVQKGVRKEYRVSWEKREEGTEREERREFMAAIPPPLGGIRGSGRRRRGTTIHGSVEVGLPDLVR